MPMLEPDVLPPPRDPSPDELVTPLRRPLGVQDPALIALYERLVIVRQGVQEARENECGGTLAGLSHPDDLEVRDEWVLAFDLVELFTIKAQETIEGIGR